MKTSLRALLLSLLLAGVAYAAGSPPIDVLVVDSSNKVVYKGKTKADGTFATGALTPGEYVVQFNSSSAGKENYLLVISAGKQKVTADSVPGSKFGGGGVAMKVNVGKGLNITGQVAQTKIAADGTFVQNGVKMKIMKGKRYVWAAGGTGSNIGGRWVEEGTPDAQNVVRMDEKGVQSLQERGNTALTGH